MIKNVLIKTLTLMFGLGVFATLSAPAHASLEICNESGKRNSIAIGYKGKNDWQSEGWWNLDSGKCVTVLKSDLTNRYYYYHSRAAGEW